MIYKEAFEKLKAEIQTALTDYEELAFRIEEKIIPLREFYRAVVDIVNDSEGWELEYEEDWCRRVHGEEEWKKRVGKVEWKKRMGKVE